MQVVYGDGSGGLGVDTAIGTATLSVLNAAPSARLTNSTQGPGLPIDEGGSATVRFIDQSDPSAADRAAGYTYSDDFDNDGVFEITGSTNPDAAVPANLVNDAGTRTVRGVIFDKDGASFEVFTGVRVLEVTPTLNLVGSDTATEGQAYALELGATDPGNDTISKWTINWGDGQSEVVNAATASLTHSSPTADPGSSA